MGHRVESSHWYCLNNWGQISLILKTVIDLLNKAWKQFKNKSSKDSLSQEQIAAIKKFYQPYKIPNMVFHRYFTEKTGEFHANYIPQDIYIHIDTYLNDLRAAKYIDNKCYYDMFFHNISHPVAYCNINHLLCEFLLVLLMLFSTKRYT